MLNCQAEEQKEMEEKMEQASEKKPEDKCPEPMSSPGKTTSDQIQMVLDCLQPHMDDPDVQGECI